MSDFVSSAWETEMTQAEIQALIDASIVANIDSTMRSRLMRAYPFTGDGAVAGDLPLPGGVRTSGVVSNVRTPILSLSTGAGGANRINEHCEKPAGLTDFMKAYGGTVGFWSRKHYAHCLVGLSSNTQPTLTQFVGLELSGMNVSPPFPVPAASYGGADPIIHVRANMSNGNWQLYQDNGTISSLTNLNGSIFDYIGLSPSRVEITYNPGVSIVVGISGTQTTVSGASLIIDPNTIGPPQYGMGVFVTSGTNAATITADFSNLYGYSVLGLS